jgi:hypothetical protein
MIHTKVFGIQIITPSFSIVANYIRQSKQAPPSAFLVEQGKEVLHIFSLIWFS